MNVTQNLTRISHPTFLECAHYRAPGTVKEDSGKILSWVGEEASEPAIVSFIYTFENLFSFNSIQLKRHPELSVLYPENFRFEISEDATVWEPILQVSGLQASGSYEQEWHFSLVRARHLKLVLLQSHKTKSGKYRAAFGAFRVLISGITQLKASSELDRLWVTQNLVDGRPDYGWSSALQSSRKPEFVEMDLGSVNQVSEIRLLSAKEIPVLFPEKFSFSYSEDNIAWHHLMEENGFLSEPGSWYQWRFAPVNMRYLRIDIEEGARTKDGKFVSQIVEVECYAESGLARPSQSVQPVSVQHASVLRAGIVRLAMNGEDREGVAVQGNDRRLKLGTTESHGIVELATDGEDREGVAVQGSDRRLKYATEDLPGIVRLARNGEDRAGHAVQGNDERLRLATEESAGLVELASDGEDKAGVAVQGNDRRLKYAAEGRPGIVALAPNLSEKPGEVVQGNDERLRRATTEYPGILRYARHKEVAPEAAVQANDPRVQPASAESQGIVRLARPGESHDGKVLVSSDPRIEPAGTGKPGIVELAEHGSELSGAAVQADDPRLSDARNPLPHSHDYAPKEHDFNSHTGTISIEEKMGEGLQVFSEVAFGSSPIYGKNTGGGPGLLGKGQDGVVGSGHYSGVLGLNFGDAPGVLGLSRRGEGGRFVSERGWSLVAGGALPARKMDFSGLGFLCKGEALFETGLFAEGGAGVLAAYFRVDGRRPLSEGDLVATTRKEHLLGKSEKQAASNVVGVVVDKAAVVLAHPGTALERDEYGNFRKPKDAVLVALAGLVYVQASAERKPIVPGDLLMASSREGHAERLNQDKYRPGVVLARSLGELKKGTGKLLVQLLCF